MISQCLVFFFTVLGVSDLLENLDAPDFTDLHDTVTTGIPRAQDQSITFWG